MTTRPFNYLCVHGHFHQPPRGNPITGQLNEESDAAPFHDWNERIAAESYRPNAEMGNFEQISFNVDQALMGWLQEHDPQTYARIVESDRTNVAAQRVGSAVASPYHHVILPLARRRDKRTQLAWGRAAFRHHYGRDPQGVWLPEMAFDLETLQTIKEAGFAYTIVSQGQVDGGTDSCGPFWVDLENGEKLIVFVRNDALSNDLSFNIGRFGGAGHWARNNLSTRRSQGSPLTLIATDGETFGHHHMGEEQFLHWLMTHEASAMGFKPITLNQYLQLFPEPSETIRLKMFSSWSCFHGVARWVTGCACTPGLSTWKGAMRRAMDNLAGDLGDLYQDMLRPYGVEPWALRDGFGPVLLGDVDGTAYLAERIDNVRPADSERLLSLLRAQAQMQQAYSSYTFFYEDFDRLEPRFAVACATYAIHLAWQATGDDLGRRFCNDLYLAHSERSALNGSQLYDIVLAELGMGDSSAPTEAETTDPTEERQLS